jgi:hypothetical protein
MSVNFWLQLRVYFFLLSFQNYVSMRFNSNIALMGTSTFTPVLQKAAGRCEAADGRRELAPEHFPEPGVMTCGNLDSGAWSYNEHAFHHCATVLMLRIASR